MKKITLVFAAVLCLVTASCVSLKHGLKPGQTSTPLSKLYADTVPLSYELSLLASTKDQGFTAEVQIALRLSQERDHILLHADELTMSHVVITDAYLNDHGAHVTKLDDDGLVSLRFKDVLAPGDYTLKISYSGAYRNDLVGLYHVSDGGERYLYTQFEPIYARKLLPCFDEPGFKTPFTLSITTEKTNEVVSNAPKVHALERGALVEHKFATTKPMPTYLLALAVGPFDIVDGPNIAANKYRKSALMLRGVAVKGKGQKLAFALKETPQILEKLEAYFGYPYPYEKLDILAVPDFRAGAMENIGAVTFRDIYLLLDEKTASADQLRAFYEVMAHELSHMWFGNLVTMKWWDDLWLNEAFATWAMYKIIQGLKPEFKSHESLLASGFGAMDEDSMQSSRKIREPIITSHDIHNAFDSITYSKGGAFLSMIESYLGESAFREAVRSHMKSYAFGNATSADFLNSLAEHADGSLVGSANTFLNQSGVPEVSLSMACQKGGFKVFVSQSRNVPLGSKVSAAREWSIPMCLGYEGRGRYHKHCFTLDSKTKFVEVKTNACPKFVMPNYQGQGYYRFSLSETDWKSLLDAPKALLADGDRLAMADSLLAGLHAGSLDIALVAGGLRGLMSAESRATSSYFITFAHEAYNHWLDDHGRQNLVDYTRPKVKAIYDTLLKKSALTPDEQSLKQQAAQFLAYVAQDPSMRSTLSQMGTTYLNGLFSKDTPKETIDQNVAWVAVGVALQNDSNDHLAEAINTLKNNDDPVVRGNLLKGIALSRNGMAASSIRELSLGDGLRKNEKLRILKRHLQDAQNQPATWNFVKDHYQEFLSQLTNSERGQLPFLAMGLCSAQAANEVSAFFKPTIHGFEGGPRTLSYVVEHIEISAAKKDHLQAEAQRFFLNNKSAVASQR